MSHRLYATAFAVVLLPSAIVAQSSLVLDQEAPADPAAPFTFAVGGASEQTLFQTVTAGIAGRLRAVDVPIGCAGGTVVLEIRNVNMDGTPGSTVLFSESYAGSDFPEVVTGAFHRMRLHGMPVRLAAGDTFTIAISNIGSSCGVTPGPVGDAYAGGEGWAEYSPGILVPLSLGTDRPDLPFRTFMQ